MRSTKAGKEKVSFKNDNLRTEQKECFYGTGLHLETKFIRGCLSEAKYMVTGVLMWVDEC